MSEKYDPSAQKGVDDIQIVFCRSCEKEVVVLPYIIPQETLKMGKIRQLHTHQCGECNATGIIVNINEVDTLCDPSDFF